MAKKKKETVVCWECKKSFKGADACKDHANAKRPRHQWQEPTASALRESLVQGPSAGPSRAVAIGTNLGPSIASPLTVEKPLGYTGSIATGSPKSMAQACRGPAG
ncbi:hypothetical protein C8Q77DRAFT_654758 [Trametes polyzona]|nr:hypothetical protein C8Q77DRAFT_654758 [Trametes polyzona]